jgi:hypothetical protein
MRTGTFTHDGATYDLAALSVLITNMPVVGFEVDALKWVLAHDTPDPERLKTAAMEEPIFVAYDKRGRFTVIDGLHRLHNAVAQGRDMLYGVLVTQAHLCQVRLD